MTIVHGKETKDRLRSTKEFFVNFSISWEITRLQFLDKGKDKKRRYFGGHGEPASFGHCVGNWEVNLW